LNNIICNVKYYIVHYNNAVRPLNVWADVLFTWKA
jgi:hypothetical protein